MDFSRRPILCLSVLLAMGPVSLGPSIGHAACSVPQAVGEVQAYAKKINSAAVYVTIDGKPVVSYGETKTKRNVHSIRKSLIGTLYGIAVEKKQIKLGSTLAELKIDDYSKLTPIEKTATVENLLSSRSGIYTEAAYETKTMRENRPERGSHKPGEFYFYNNFDFNVLGTIYEQQTHSKIGDAFKRQIAGPLGMKDFEATDVSYRSEVQSKHRAYIMQMTAEDMARFGQLMLDNGKVDGVQVVPREWIAKSTSVVTDRGPGKAEYGYLWHVHKADEGIYGAQVGGPAFSAVGHYGQYITVIPNSKMVIVNQTSQRVPFPKKDYKILVDLIQRVAQCKADRAA
jgi:CubicO group peptidase (beta-lactamase class C family)